MERAMEQRFGHLVGHFGPTTDEGREAPSGRSSLSARARMAYPEEDQVRILEPKKAEILEGLLTRMRSDRITNIDEVIEIGLTTLASFTPKNPVAASRLEYSLRPSF
jgi:hypothetical protein